MRFIKLEILNLASLDRNEGEVIDFEKGALGGSNIFSIVGPTGSGKSTILDAICLALYSHAPRYPKKGERNQSHEIFGTQDEGERNRLAPTDCRNILTRGKKYGYSKLTFLANNGKVYRAEWSVRFNRKNYDSVVTALYEIGENGSETECEWKSLPDIIGLDYDQFLSTVLIAQGSFAKFIDAKENERYELLEKLIGCQGLYTSIANEIKEKKDQAVKAYDTLMADYSALGKDIVSPDELEPLKQKIDELQKVEDNIKADLIKVTESLKWYETAREYTERIERFQQDLTKAKEALDAMKEDTARLELHDSTLKATELFKEIKDTRDEINREKENLKKLEEHIQTGDEAIKAAGNELTRLKNKQQEADAAYKTQKPHIDKARTIKGELESARKAVVDRQADFNAAKSALDQANQDVDRNKTDIENAQKALNDATQAHTLLKEETDKKKAELAENVDRDTKAYNSEMARLAGLDGNKLQQAQRDADTKKADIKEAIRIKSDLKSRQEAIDANIKEINRLTERNKDIDKELAALTIDTDRAELETLTKSYTLMSSQDWASHRHSLEDGKPCPLCGATTHPYVKDEVLVPVVNEMKALIDTKRAELKKQEDKQSRLIGESSKNKGTIESLANAYNTLQDEKAGLESNWNDIHSTYPQWPDDLEGLKQLQPVLDDEARKATDALNAFNALTASTNRLMLAKDKSVAEQKEYNDNADRQIREADKAKTDANTLLQTEKGKTANLKKQQQEKQQAFTKADAALNEAVKVVENKKQDIAKEIGDKDPDTLDQELTRAKQEADDAVEKKNTEIQTLVQENEGLKGQRTTVTENIRKASEKNTKTTANLDEWISKYNDKHSASLTVSDIEMLYMAPDDWDAVRARQKELNNNLTTAQTTLSNEQNAYKDHQKNKPAESEDDLKTRKDQLDSHTNTELTDAKARLQRHTSAEQQLGQLVDKKNEAELAKREWDQIFDAIGADGKTLRKIAQCYTLRFLVEHANAEIRKFNNRYELQQIKNSLGLRVIDHDRADDVRETTSLSGGERFIVSLGLALGLSSLSSRNISFENLFIDEGFGTLDPDTLAVVIDSLAMLQSSQGKKVGVISHTNTMSERITTQIEIVKDGNSGSSYIKFNP
jgi:exonuclease SbcC